MDKDHKPRLTVTHGRKRKFGRWCCSAAIPPGAVGYADSMHLAYTLWLIAACEPKQESNHGT